MELHGSWADKRRKLEHGQYLSLFLFAFAQSGFAHVTGRVHGQPMGAGPARGLWRGGGLGQFSEAQVLVDEEFWKRFSGLAAEVQGPPPKDPHVAWQKWFPRTVRSLRRCRE